MEWYKVVKAYNGKVKELAEWSVKFMILVCVRAGNSRVGQRARSVGHDCTRKGFPERITAKCRSNFTKETKPSSSSPRDIQLTSQKHDERIECSGAWIQYGWHKED
jgi:hypothetical protein